MSSVDGKVEWKMVIIKNLFDHIVPAQAQLADSFALPTYTFFSRIIRKFCIFSDDSPPSKIKLFHQIMKQQPIY